MSLYKKTILFVCLVFVLLTSLLYFTAQFVILHGFHDLESRYILRSVQHLQSAILGRLSHLSVTSADWAEWDDTFAFARRENPGYIQNNLVDATFTTLDLNLILFASPDGKILYAKAYDLNAGREVPVPDGLRAHLKPGSPLLRLSPGDGTSGMLQIPEGLLLIVSRAILTSAKTGPSPGVLIMARFLDSGETGEFSRLIHYPVTILPLREGALSPESREVLSRVTNQPSTFIQSENGDIVSGYLLLKDIYGKPTAITRVDMDRDIYRQGRHVLYQLLLCLLLIAVVFGGLATLIVERGILARLSRLVRDVRAIGSQGDVSGRLTVEGKDEITAFAFEMNRMIESLQSAQEKLLLSEERMRAQYRRIPLPTITWRKTGGDFELVDYNDAMIEMTGGKIAIILGKTASALLLERPALAEAFERCRREQTKVVLEKREKPLSLENERFLRYSLNCVPPDLVVLHVEDITERKQAETKLLSMQRKLRSLASELSIAEERERRRVAMHLHDDIGHVLALCQFRLEALQEKAPEEIGPELEEIRDAVVSAINETRSLTFQLCPPVLYDLGLAAALDWLGEQTSRKHGLPVKVREEAGTPRLETELRALLFQSTRELLFNVVKHAEAKTATITIRPENNCVLVMVEDDGRGFDTVGIDAPGEETGFGLFNIRERLNHIGGNLDIHSIAGEGTRVILTAPLQRRRGTKHETLRE